MHINTSGDECMHTRKNIVKMYHVYLST